MVFLCLWTVEFVIWCLRMSTICCIAVLPWQLQHTNRGITALFILAFWNVFTHLCHVIIGSHITTVIVESSDVKVLWDLNIYTDHFLFARFPDMSCGNRWMSEDDADYWCCSSFGLRCFCKGNWKDWGIQGLIDWNLGGKWNVRYLLEAWVA